MGGAVMSWNEVPESTQCKKEMNFICDLFPTIDFRGCIVFEHAGLLEESEHFYVLPTWNILHQDYLGACLLVIKKLQEIHCVNFDFNLSRVKQTNMKRHSMNELYRNVNNKNVFFVLPGHTKCNTCKGKSLSEIEKYIDPKVLLIWGLYEGLMFSFTHYETLSKTGMFLELGGDIYRKADGSVHTPVLSFSDGKIELGLRHRASRHCDVYLVPILRISN